MATTVATPQESVDHFNKYENDCERPGFRNFTPDNTARFKTVFETYTKMHTHQCVDYVTKKHDEWLKFNHGQHTIMEAIHMLDGLVDEADPDVDFPNSFHAFQTAEGLRKQYPDLDWLHLTGLIHDLGKVMALWGEPQFSTVGDTYVVGAEFAPSIVYRENTFSKNPDLHDPRYNTKYGMYEPNCGLDNLLLSWGHDEYLYRVMLHNKCTIPKEGLYCIRFHSFYPWHTGGDYEHLCSEEDMKMKDWIRKFNEHDLYTKSPDLPDVEALKPYYQELIDKYIPGKLKW